MVKVAPDQRPAHGAIMEQLDFTDGMRLTDLARGAQLTPQSAGELVDQLESLGYVERRPDPDDRRAKRIFRTAKAKKATNAAIRAAQRSEQSLRALLGDHRYSATSQRPHHHHRRPGGHSRRTYRDPRGDWPLRDGHSSAMSSRRRPSKISALSEYRSKARKDAKSHISNSASSRSGGAAASFSSSNFAASRSQSSSSRVPKSVSRRTLRYRCNCLLRRSGQNMRSEAGTESPQPRLPDNSASATSSNLSCCVPGYLSPYTAQRIFRCWQLPHESAQTRGATRLQPGNTRALATGWIGFSQKAPSVEPPWDELDSRFLVLRCPEALLVPMTLLVTATRNRARRNSPRTNTPAAT